MKSSRSENTAREQSTVQRPVEDHNVYEDHDVFEDHYVFPLGKLFRVVLVRWWAVALVAGVFASATVGFTLVQPPMYQASAQMLVGQQDHGLIEHPADAEGIQELTQTLVTAVGSRSVAEDVITRLDLKITPEDLLDNLTAQQIPSTQFIQLGYKDPNPERARKVANTAAEVFSKRMAKLNGSGSSAVTVTVWDKAVTPSIPVSPRPKRNGALALVLGGFAGVCLAFLVEYLNQKSGKSPRRGPAADGDNGEAG
jgi:capsular polysaccharide biosynthesis protein